MTELTGMTRDELIRWTADQGFPAYRGKQIFSWIHRGADFDGMSDLPAGMREELKEKAVAQCVKIRTQRVSDLDGTVKFLFSLEDGNCVEGVLMHYHYGESLCISTQVGCRMGCRFCASTLEGKIRDLSAGEMLGQILAANRTLAEGKRISHVVLMGSGEPLDNYQEVIRFLRLLREEEGIHLSLRNVSLSTCGLVDKMHQLAEEGLSVTLCISLHAPNDTVRKQLMPVAQRWKMAEVLGACRNYVAKTGRRVIFEYALVHGINAAPEQARELAGHLRGLQCHVNLIPLNEVKERNLQGVSASEARRFLEELKRCRISATLRREMGDDIEGACGQLRRKTLMTEEGGDWN